MCSVSRIAAAALLFACVAARAQEVDATGIEPSPPPSSATADVVPRPYVIEQIAVVGNTSTREWKIRRHLLVREGDLLDDDQVLLSRLKLLQLGWFSGVDTRVERGTQRGRVVLIFTVTERNTLLVSDLIFGSTGPQPLYGGAGLSEQNFMGIGLGLSGAFVYGGSPSGRPDDPARFAVRATFFEPDMQVPGLSRPLVFGLTALGVRGEELVCDTPGCDPYEDHFGNAPRLRYSRVGGEITLGVRPGPFDRLLAGYRFESLHARFLPGEGDQPTSSGPYVERGRSKISALTLTYSRDTRDDIFFPTDGSRLAGQITFSSRALGSDYEYSRYMLQLERAFAGPRGHGIRFLGTLGAVQGDAPFFDRFYAADFAYFTKGPAIGRALELNFSTDSRYDSLLGVIGCEYGIPIWSSGGFFRRGAVALGARLLWSADRPKAGATRVSSIPFSADMALRFDTPVGIFNASLGYALDNFL